MKRFVLLGLVALSVFAVPASAQVVMYRQEVPFVLKRAAVSESEWDSLVVSHAGSRTDTSAAFRLDGWARIGGAAAADSVPLLHFEYAVIPGTTVTAASSTTTAILQMSSDGVNWASASAASLDPFGAAPVALTALNTGAYSRTVDYVGAVQSDQVVNSRFLRFVVASAASGQFKLAVSWPRVVVGSSGSPQFVRSPQ